MARRSDHTREELAKLILEATFELVNKGGYSSVSTRKIASKIGYTVGTLYNVFTNLDDIFVHINARVIDMMLDKLRSVIIDSNDSKDSIYLLSYEYLKFAEQNYNLWNIFFEYRFPSKQIFPNWYYAKINELFDIVENSIGKVVKCNPQELRIFSANMWAGIHGICALTVKDKLTRLGIKNSEVLVKEFLDNMFKGQKI